MACKRITVNRDSSTNETLFFGIDSEFPANMILQNNLSQFEWVLRNQEHPSFWGRYIGSGKNDLTQEEITFLHTKGCRIVPIYNRDRKDRMDTHPQGVIDAKKAYIAATELGITPGVTIFVELDPFADVSSDYLLGYADTLIHDGYIPGFYANTDSNDSDFSHQFSRGCQNNPEIFSQCQIWARAPHLAEFFETMDAHTIVPDKWKPYSPSCLSRSNIAIWQYGVKSHPAYNNDDENVNFNVNILKNSEMMLYSMI